MLYYHHYPGTGELVTGGCPGQEESSSFIDIVVGTLEGGAPVGFGLWDDILGYCSPSPFPFCLSAGNSPYICFRAALLSSAAYWLISRLFYLQPGAWLGVFHSASLLAIFAWCLVWFIIFSPI